MKTSTMLDLELRTITSMQATPAGLEPTAAGLEVAALQARDHDLSAMTVAEPRELQRSPNQSSPFPAVAGAPPSSVTAYTLARPQPALARFGSAQSNQTLVSSLNWSMSDLANNPVDNAALENGLNSSISDGARLTVMTRVCQGHHHQALEALVAGHGLHIKFAASAVMFGMTVAGLWLAIVGAHQTIV